MNFAVSNLASAKKWVGLREIEKGSTCLVVCLWNNDFCSSVTWVSLVHKGKIPSSVHTSTLVPCTTDPIYLLIWEFEKSLSPRDGCSGVTALAFLSACSHAFVSVSTCPIQAQNSTSCGGVRVGAYELDESTRAGQKLQSQREFSTHFMCFLRVFHEFSLFFFLNRTGFTGTQPATVTVS